MISKTQYSKFEKDPFGYCLTAAMEWHNQILLNTINYNPPEKPSGDDLKDPVLWFCQSKALSQAGLALLKVDPDYSSMPPNLKGVLYRQHFGSALMLIAYGLEVNLKATHLYLLGLERYKKEEKKFKHHNLKKLAGGLIDLTSSESAVLECLSEVAYWAGRYPDHGDKKTDKLEHILSLSENHEIALKQLIETANKIMKECAEKVDY